MFAGHCSVGIFGIGYFTYKTFLNKKESVYDKTTESFKFKSPLFRNLCKTVSIFFLVTVYSYKPKQFSIIHSYVNIIVVICRCATTTSNLKM